MVPTSVITPLIPLARLPTPWKGRMGGGRLMRLPCCSRSHSIGDGAVFPSRTAIAFAAIPDGADGPGTIGRRGVVDCVSLIFRPPTAALSYVDSRILTNGLL